MRDAGLPQHLAMKVAKGDLSLNDALGQVVDKDRVERVMARHDLERSLATQIVMGRVSLDKILLRRRREQHIAENHGKSILDEALKDGRPRIFGLHGHRIVRAKVMKVDAYEVTLEADEADAPAGPLGAMHKLQLKFAMDAPDSDALRKNLGNDPTVQGEPIERPQDRYRCANKRLFAWLDAKTPLEFTTLEGEVVCGPLNWIGRWELGVSIGGDEQLVLFRHALANISGGEWGSIKDD